MNGERIETSAAVRPGAVIPDHDLAKVVRGQMEMKGLNGLQKRLEGTYERVYGLADQLEGMEGMLTGKVGGPEGAILTGAEDAAETDDASKLESLHRTVDRIDRRLRRALSCYERLSQVL